MSVLFSLSIFLTACQSSAQVLISTETPSITETLLFTTTPFLSDTPTQTQTVLIIPKITATPIIKSFNSDDDLKNLINQIYPFPCIGYNYAKAPLSDVNHASELTFIEVDVQPDPNKYWVSEIADNADGSRQAFVATIDSQRKTTLINIETKEVLATLENTVILLKDEKHFLAHNYQTNIWSFWDNGTIKCEYGKIQMFDNKISVDGNIFSVFNSSKKNYKYGISQIVS